MNRVCSAFWKFSQLNIFEHYRKQVSPDSLMNQPKKSALELNKENADLKNQLMQISKHRDSLNKEKSLLQSKNETLTKKNEVLENELQKLKQSSTALKENNNQLKKDLLVWQSRELNQSGLSSTISQNQLKETLKIKHQLDAENSSLLSELNKTKSNLDVIKQKYKEKVDEIYLFQKKLAISTSEIDGLKLSGSDFSKNKKSVNTEDRKWEVRYSQLSDKITDFTQEVSKKEKDLPTLGTNNVEEIDVQAFINFVILSSENLGSFVSNGPITNGNAESSVNNETTQRSSPQVTNNEETTCKMCHEKKLFATCGNASCKSTFHEECIRVWFKTQRGCPCCHEDTFHFQEFNSRRRY